MLNMRLLWTQTATAIYTLCAKRYRSYIKELADRLNSLESQLQPTNSATNFDFGGLSDPNFTSNQSRPSWSGQDRGNCCPTERDMVSLLTAEEPQLNGNRRTSFGEMSLIGSLVTGSNEDILKA
jgi:hypothetical protein